ncbi:hypothetical protein QQF64_020779 [Cirrhinus molitorella]|uniref:Uncharacterized protein n=1 Tax=Cirrhinus molitorella TaxID=172907 RepID=A0ABR3LDI9_9TELE
MCSKGETDEEEEEEGRAKVVKITFLHKQALKMVAEQNAFLTFLSKCDQFLHLAAGRSVGEMTAAAGCQMCICVRVGQWRRHRYLLIQNTNNISFERLLHTLGSDCV